VFREEFTLVCGGHGSSCNVAHYRRYIIITISIVQLLYTQTYDGYVKENTERRMK